jgi:hypothetical protein
MDYGIIDEGTCTTTSECMVWVGSFFWMFVFCKAELFFFF